MAKNKSKPVALLDMDGTLCDFAGPMRTAMLALQSPGEPDFDWEDIENVPYLKARSRLVKAQPGFWRDLKPIQLGFCIKEQIKRHGFSLNILTRGPRKIPQAFAEKVEWCNKYIPEAKITTSEDKGVVCGALLVDDWIPYVERWLKKQPGYVLMPAQPWNEGYTHDRVLRVGESDFVAADMWIKEIAEWYAKS